MLWCIGTRNANFQSQNIWQMLALRFWNQFRSFSTCSRVQRAHPGWCLKHVNLCSTLTKHVVVHLRQKHQFPIEIMCSAKWRLLAVWLWDQFQSFSACSRAQKAHPGWHTKCVNLCLTRIKWIVVHLHQKRPISHLTAQNVIVGDAVLGSMPALFHQF